MSQPKMGLVQVSLNIDWDCGQGLAPRVQHPHGFLFLLYNTQPQQRCCGSVMLGGLEVVMVCHCLACTLFTAWSPSHRHCRLCMAATKPIQLSKLRAARVASCCHIWTHTIPMVAVCRLLPIILSCLDCAGSTDRNGTILEALGYVYDRPGEGWPAGGFNVTVRVKPTDASGKVPAPVTQGLKSCQIISG